jgi:hypothetical protein
MFQIPGKLGKRPSLQYMTGHIEKLSVCVKLNTYPIERPSTTFRGWVINVSETS